MQYIFKDIKQKVSKSLHPLENQFWSYHAKTTDRWRTSHRVGDKIKLLKTKIDNETKIALFSLETKTMVLRDYVPVNKSLAWSGRASYQNCSNSLKSHFTRRIYSRPWMGKCMMLKDTFFVWEKYDTQHHNNSNSSNMNNVNNNSTGHYENFFDIVQSISNQVTKTTMATNIAISDLDVKWHSDLQAAIVIHSPDNRACTLCQLIHNPVVILQIMP